MTSINYSVGRGLEEEAGAEGVSPEGRRRLRRRRGRAVPSFSEEGLFPLPILPEGSLPAPDCSPLSLGCGAPPSGVR